jgi:hypothetical protein
MEEFNSKQAQSKHTERCVRALSLAAPHLIEPGMLHALKLNVRRLLSDGQVNDNYCFFEVASQPDLLKLREWNLVVAPRGLREAGLSVASRAHVRR